MIAHLFSRNQFIIGAAFSLFFFYLFMRLGLSKCHSGKTLHVRKTTRAEQRQKTLYDALGIPANPGATIQTIMD